MEQKVISMREIQRNYKSIIEKAKTQKRPVFLGAHGKAQAVLLDIEDYEKLQGELRTLQQRRSWKRTKAMLDRFLKEGAQGVSLSDFVRHDRRSH